MAYTQKYMNNYISKIIAKSTMPDNANVAEKIQYFALEAYKQDIADWTDARLFAIDPIVPDWTDLIRVYDDVMVDAHVSGIIRAIKKKVKAKDFFVYDENMEVDEELTKLFDSRWFSKFIDLVILSDIYPYSVCQLGDWDNGFNDLTEIKREYYVKQYNRVKRSLYVSARPNDLSGFDLNSPQLEPYFISMHSDEELGLLDHVAPLALGKKHMLIYWWRYGEQFGLPFKIGKTDADDPKRRKALENVFKNMGSNTWMVSDVEDQIEFISPSDKSGSVSVFLENLNYANNEISKTIAGAVGIFDAQSFVGSAEAGERMLDTIIGSYCKAVETYVNTDLIPKIINTYKDNRFANRKFHFDYTENISFEERLQALNILATHFNLDVEEISEKFGFQVTEKVTDFNEMKNLNAKYMGIRQRKTKENAGKK